MKKLSKFFAAGALAVGLAGCELGGPGTPASMMGAEDSDLTKPVVLGLANGMDAVINNVKKAGSGEYFAVGQDSTVVSILYSKNEDLLFTKTDSVSGGNRAVRYVDSVYAPPRENNGPFLQSFVAIGPSAGDTAQVYNVVRVSKFAPDWNGEFITATNEMCHFVKPLSNPVQASSCVEGLSAGVAKKPALSL